MKTLRVAYLLKKFPRLSETFVLGEILRQESIGTEVHVFSRKVADDEPRHPEFASLQAEVEVLPSPGRLDVLGELFDPPGLSEVPLEQVGALVGELRPFQHPRLSRLFGEALYLRRRTAELGIQHVHAHFATDSALVAMVLRGLGGPSYSVTAHAKDIYRSTVNPALLSRIVAHSAFTVTVCEANVRFLRERLSGAARSKLCMSYNGIDLQAFQPPTTPREENHILAVGRLVPKKGFDVLIAALAILRAEGQPFRATIVGQGDERERLEELLRVNGLEDAVHMTGPLDQGAVRKLTERATLMCLPCTIDMDGNRDALPTVLLEALACGLPIVSTPVTGVPEILAEGRVGLLVPERDAQATATALRELLTDSQRRTQLALDGRVHAEQHFGSQDAALRLRRCLEQGRPCMQEGEPCTQEAHPRTQRGPNQCA